MSRQKTYSNRRVTKRTPHRTRAIKNGIRSGRGGKKQAPDIIHQPTKKNPALRLDPLLPVKLKLEAKKGRPANWLEIFRRRFDLNLDIANNKLEWFKVLKMYATIPGFNLTQKESLLDVAKRAYDFSEDDYKYIAVEEEMALTEVSFDTDRCFIDFQIKDIERIGETDPKKMMAIMLLVRFCLREHRFGLQKAQELPWELESILEALSYDMESLVDPNDEEEIMDLHGSSIWSFNEIRAAYNWVMKTYSINSFNDKNRKLIVKLQESGYYKSIGLNYAVHDLLHRSISLSPYMMSSYQSNTYAVFPSEQQDERPVMPDDICMFSYNSGTESPETYMSLTQELMNNYGAAIFFNVYGENAVFEDHETEEVFKAFEKIEKVIIAHETNQTHYNLHKPEE